LRAEQGHTEWLTSQSRIVTTDHSSAQPSSEFPLSGRTTEQRLFNTDDTLRTAGHGLELMEHWEFGFWSSEWRRESQFAAANKQNVITGIINRERCAWKQMNPWFPRKLRGYCSGTWTRTKNKR
jgi:hypothetical protein